MKPIILAILDGFGYSGVKKGNAIAAAHKPSFDQLDRFWPTITLQASGIAVGLPWNEEGNSEVGHLTIGSGRVVWQHLPRINMAMEDGSFFTNPAFRAAARVARARTTSVHLIGLVSSGTVHSSLDHLKSLVELFVKEGVERVFLHAVTDGRDAPPHEAAKILAGLQRYFSPQPQVAIASVIGRHFALDRDNHWDRVQRAFRLFVEGNGVPITDPASYLKQEYLKGFSDDMMEPAVVVKEGKAVGVVRPKDAVVFFNFREDSMRELHRAFTAEAFTEFERQKPDVFIATMTSYEEGAPVEVAFPSLKIEKTLAEVFCGEGTRQLHIAETSKYAHVTYFFDGLRPNSFEREEYLVIPSERELGLEEAPEMKAPEIVDAILKRWHEFDFIVANFANADQVGHTGNFQATLKAVEALDVAVGAIMRQVEAEGGAFIITADHGNAELKFDITTGEVRTEHTTNPVPFYLVAKDWRLGQERSPEELQKIRSEIAGVLTDVAPTILELAGLGQPREMGGKSLIRYLKKQLH